LGAVYVVNGRVRRIDPSGIIATFAGTGGTGNWGDGGPATLANVSWARDVAVAPDGSVCISQDIWYRIRRVTPDGIINTVMGTGSGTFSGDGGPATRAGGVPIGLGVARNGTLYLATGSQHRIRRVALPLPGFSNNDLALASVDGSELYEFDAAGRHLRPRDATTGAMLYAFDYTPDGLLSRVTDADGRVTEIERDGAGEPTAIVAPFGQRTTIALDATGYLATLTNPANEAVTLGHTPDGLLTLMADGKGNEKHYGYDGRGRLESAEDPRGGTKTLARADGLSDYTVTVTRGLGRATAYRTEFLSTGEEERRTTGPDGLATTTTYGTDGGTTVATPDGTTTYQREGADPRWGMHAPLLQQLSVTTPGGRAFDQTAVRRATLTNLADPFSLQTELDSVRINGRVFSLYEASELRYTATSATGRQSITRVDSIGRVLEQSVPGITATSYSYNAQGFLEQVAQGGRSWSYGYDSQGRLAWSRDPLQRTDSLYYDDADRLIRQVLPNGSEILYGYDANGNLTSLTPPGRPAHGFAYDAADQDSVYAPPPLGTGSWATEYRYDLGQQLTKVIRPDAQEIALGYDFAGRLDTLTTPTGSYSFGYSASGGQLTSVSAPGGSTLTYGYDGFLPTAVGWSGPVSGSVGVSYDNNFWVTQQTVNGSNASASVTTTMGCSRARARSRSRVTRRTG
jgi:YD repeat-containing protein